VQRISRCCVGRSQTPSRSCSLRRKLSTPAMVMVAGPSGLCKQRTYTCILVSTYVLDRRRVGDAVVSKRGVVGFPCEP
jgi:hypothetical protein